MLEGVPYHQNGEQRDCQYGQFVLHATVMRILPKNLVLEILGAIGWVGELPAEVESNGMTGYRGTDVLGLIVPTGFKLNYTSRSGDEVMVTDGIVSGTIDKRGIGAEDGRLLDAVVQTHGSDAGAEFLNRMTKMTIAVST